jgi:MerR family transcriptional regulator, light-induced transcriptional regulator
MKQGARGRVSKYPEVLIVTEILSTREVAALLKVSEATVKRWSDANMITCLRTPGGHRKFRRQDIRKLIGLTEEEIAAATPLPKVSAQAIDDVLLAGNIRATASILQSKGLAPEALAEICDTIFVPSFSLVGLKWERGELSIAEEHRASATLIDALAQTLARLPEPPQGAPIAALACIGDEQHDMGLRMVRLILHSIGFATVLLGGTVPVLDLSALVSRSSPPPAILALSASPKASPSDLRGHLAVLSSATRTLGVALVTGGRGFATLEERETQSNAKHFEALLDFVPFAKGILSSHN